jgi:hypothetical protein
MSQANQKCADIPLSKSEILRRLDVECPTLKTRIKLDFSDPATCELLESIRELLFEAKLRPVPVV